MAKFRIEELVKTSTGIANIPNEQEKKNLELLLEFLNKIGTGIDYPVIVNSGFRCEAVNKKVGGVATSHHRLGLAADLTCKDVAGLVEHLKQYLDELDQLIWYPKRNFVHVSIHSSNRRQYFEK